LARIRGIRPGVIASANWWDWSKKGQPYLDIAVTETKHFPEGNKTPGETCWCLEQSWFWNKRFRPKKARDIVRQIEIANSRNANFLLNVAPDDYPIIAGLVYKVGDRMIYNGITSLSNVDKDINRAMDDEGVFSEYRKIVDSLTLAPFEIRNSAISFVPAAIKGV